MPSSTSSSEPVLEPAVLRLRWGTTWLLALALLALSLAGIEGWCRAAGFSPSVRDDPATWAASRGRVRADSVVLVGTSRIQAAIDPTAWADAWDGAAPVQLAIAGDSPLPILEDLAADASFRGLVIVEILPRILFGGRGTEEREARRFLDEWALARVSPSRRSEARLRILATGALAVRSLPPGQMLGRLLRPGAPRVPYFSMDGSRFLRLDFARADLERRRATIESQILESRAASVAQRETVVARLLAAESALLLRGAEIVLLHLPRRDAVARIEEERFPTAEHWDALVARSRAVALHADRVPALAGFGCPDGSHLDVRDAPRFTRALAETLRARLQRS